MKRIGLTQIGIFIFILMAFTGCEVVGDIFEAGLWVGVFIVVLVLVLIIWLIRKFMG